MLWILIGCFLAAFLVAWWGASIGADIFRRSHCSKCGEPMRPFVGEFLHEEDPICGRCCREAVVERAQRDFVATMRKEGTWDSRHWARGWEKGRRIHDQP